MTVVRFLTAAAWCLVLTTQGTLAQDIGATGAGGVPDTSVATPDTSGQPSAATTAAPSIQSSLGAFGDPGGLRSFLDAKGIDYSFTYIGEVLGNPSGGLKRGATYDGRLDGELDVDLQKLASIPDAALHVSFYEINGRGLSGNNLLDLFTVSNIEAYPTARLYEAFYEQKLFGGKAALRVGQLAADTEFFVSQTATLFMGATFGFPSSLADNLPSGGPDYPFAAPGLRLKVNPLENVTLLAALFDGDPAGPYRPNNNSILPQLRNPSGTNFRLQDSPLLLTEAQIAYNTDASAKGLPGVLKAGYLHHFGDFAATDRPAAQGVSYQGDDGVYALIDQTIYREGPNGQQGASMFLRAFAMPGDRNLFDLYVDGGVSYQGPFTARPDDTVGVSFAYGRISPSVGKQDAVTGSPLVRDYQAVLEATYQITIKPGLTVQPDFQYVFHPGARGVADPQTGLPLRDAAVFGLRASVRY